MILAAIAAGIAMGVKDFLGSLTVRLEAGDHGLLAGVADLLGDYGAIVTYGVAGIEIIRHGVGVYTVVVLAAVGAASLLATWGGTKAGHALCARLAKESQR